MHLLKYVLDKRALAALRRRQEIVKAGLSRRDLIKLGLLTSTGMLIKEFRPPDAWAQFGGGGGGGGDFQGFRLCNSPATTPFMEQMPIPPVNVATVLSPAPQAAPNTAAGEGRTLTHQAFNTFPFQKQYAVTQKPGTAVMHPQLPTQDIWGFAAGTPSTAGNPTAPGVTYVAKYGEPILVRNYNQLPAANGGFGLNSVTTHLHNGHTPAESDGGPCMFFGTNKFYDHHYPNVLAGVLSTHQAQGGDINEAMSSLWYHDHRVDFTAQNVYKGLHGHYLLFNQFDTGDEGTGFRLPSYPQFDIPITFNDKCFDPQTGKLFFDLNNIAGILGDKFLANGKIQPFFPVAARRYRFRCLNTGPSRFVQFFLTKVGDPTSTQKPKMWQISNDGNLLPKPVLVNSFRMGVAERVDVVIDFTGFSGQSFYFENRLKQTDGRGADGGQVLGAGQGINQMRFDVGAPAPDGSADPATQKFYALPSTTATPRITRTFEFSIGQGSQWTINDQLMDCTDTRFRVQKNSVERWRLINNANGGFWWHPIHIHFEEHQVLSIDGHAPSATELIQNGRKDVLRLEAGTTVDLFFRFRDFQGSYPMHCHNVVHEDHAMLLIFDIAATGDNQTRP